MDAGKQPFFKEIAGQSQGIFNVFRHGTEYKIGEMTLLSSYHCSRYNTNTRRLTEEMFDAIFARARAIIDA